MPELSNLKFQNVREERKVKLLIQEEIDKASISSGSSSGGTAISTTTKSKQLAPITVKTTDAYEGRCLTALHRLKAWAGDDVEFFIGEMGYPTDRTGQDALDWARLAESSYSLLTGLNIGHYTWATGHDWSDGYNLKPYKKTAGVWSDTHLSPILEKFAGNYNVGLNWASLEFGEGVNAPTLEDLAYHKNKGWKKLRLPIRLDFLTDWDTGVFKAGTGLSNFQKIVDTLNRCQQLDMEVMIDVHMYAAWNATVTGATNVLNATNRAAWYKAYNLLLTTNIADANGTVSQLKDHPSLFMFDLMNEPAAISETAWVTESQLLVDYLRTTINYTRKISVGLPFYSGILGLPDKDFPKPWIVDPLSKIAYQGHIYFDYTRSSAGKYWTDDTNTVPVTYAMELAAAITAGSPTNVSYSNTKGASTAKLLGTQGFKINGGTAHNATIAIPSGTTKAVIVFTTDLSPTPAITAVTVGGVACDQLINYQKSFVSASAYSIDNPTGTALSIVTSAATNCSVLVQYWSGLRPLLLQPNLNVKPAELFGSNFATVVGTAKRQGSVLVNYAFANTNLGTTSMDVQERKVNLDNPTIPAGNVTGGGQWSYSINSQYVQMGEPSIVNYTNEWQQNGNFLGIVLELDTEAYEILSPGSTSTATPTLPISGTTATKASIGLGNVDNTSDLAKPVSTAQQTAIDNSRTDIPDNIFSVVGDVDSTKEIKFNADTLATGTTKTLGLPSVSAAAVTIALLEAANVFSAPQTINTTVSTSTGNSHTINLINSNTTATTVEARAIRTSLIGTANANDRANLILGRKVTVAPAANNVIIDTSVPATGLDFIVATDDSFRTATGHASTFHITGSGVVKAQRFFNEIQSTVAATSSTNITKGTLYVGANVTAGNHVVNLPNHVSVSTSGQLMGTDFAGATFKLYNRRFAAADTVTLVPAAGATFTDGVKTGLANQVVYAGEMVTVDWDFNNLRWIIVSKYNSNEQEIVVDNIDLLTTGIKPLFTVPSGRTIEVQSLKLLPTQKTGTVTTVPTASVDSTAVGDIYASRSMIGFGSLTEGYNFVDSGGVITYATSGSTIALNVTTAMAGATVFNVRAKMKISVIG